MFLFNFYTYIPDLQNFFDYYGGILTYAIQVIPVFFLDSYKDLSPGDFAQQISNVWISPSFLN